MATDSAAVPPSTPMLKRSCSTTSKSTLEEWNAMYAKVKELKDKQALRVFLEDMKLINSIVRKWSGRFDWLLAEKAAGKENVVEFRSTLDEVRAEEARRQQVQQRFGIGSPTPLSPHDPNRRPRGWDVASPLAASPIGGILFQGVNANEKTPPPPSVAALPSSPATPISASPAVARKAAHAAPSAPRQKQEQGLESVRPLHLRSTEVNATPGMPSSAGVRRPRSALKPSLRPTPHPTTAITPARPNTAHPTAVPSSSSSGFPRTPRRPSSAIGAPKIPPPSAHMPRHRPAAGNSIDTTARSTTAASPRTPRRLAVSPSKTQPRSSLLSSGSKSHRAAVVTPPSTGGPRSHRGAKSERRVMTPAKGGGHLKALDLSRFPDSFQCGEGAEQLLAVWAEFHRTFAAQRNHTLSVSQLERLLPRVRAEVLVLLLDLLESRGLLKQSLSGTGLGTLWQVVQHY